MNKRLLFFGNDKQIKHVVSICANKKVGCVATWISSCRIVLIPEYTWDWCWLPKHFQTNESHAIKKKENYTNYDIKASNRHTWNIASTQSIFLFLRIECTTEKSSVRSHTYTIVGPVTFSFQPTTLSTVDKFNLFCNSLIERRKIK